VIIIKTLHFEDYEDFAYDVSDVYERVKSDDEYNSVNVVAKYEGAKEIIRELIEVGYSIAFIDDFGNPKWDDYDDAFVISLYDDEIWCEPVKRKDGYIFVEADVVYIFDDCNSKIIPKIESDEVYEVEIGNEYDNCDGDCDHCDCKEIDKDYYSINGKQVSQAEFEKKTKEIQKTYDSLNDWLNIVDAFPEIYKRLMNYACYLDKLDESFWY
jgi:hypothetical protein